MQPPSSQNVVGCATGTKRNYRASQTLLRSFIDDTGVLQAVEDLCLHKMAAGLYERLQKVMLCVNSPLYIFYSASA